MIFVTVGTHEQQFNRLIKKVDELIDCGYINEEVIIQSGFSTYTTERCKCEKIIPYEEMVDNINKARIIITHGGPATFIMPLQIGKIPIVVPRQKKFDEHVNNHQLDFAKMVKERNGNIILIENIDDLNDILNDYDNIIKRMPKEVLCNNNKFNQNLKEIVYELYR